MRASNLLFFSRDDEKVAAHHKIDDDISSMLSMDTIPPEILSDIIARNAAHEWHNIAAVCRRFAAVVADIVARDRRAVAEGRAPAVLVPHSAPLIASYRSEEIFALRWRDVIREVVSLQSTAPALHSCTCDRIDFIAILRVWKRDIQRNWRAPLYPREVDALDLPRNNAGLVIIRPAVSYLMWLATTSPKTVADILDIVIGELQPYDSMFAESAVFSEIADGFIMICSNDHWYSWRKKQYGTPFILRDYIRAIDDEWRHYQVQVSIALIRRRFPRATSIDIEIIVTLAAAAHAIATDDEMADMIAAVPRPHTRKYLRCALDKKQQ